MSKMNIKFDDLMNKIIPPLSYVNREGFNNENILTSLNPSLKTEVEEALIKMLLSEEIKITQKERDEPDLLIMKSLKILKSSGSVPIMKKYLELNLKEIHKIAIASIIYEIIGDEKMVDFVIQNCNKITDNFTLIASFSYLTKMKNEKTKEFLLRFVDHKEFLVSYNAKRYLEF